MTSKLPASSSRRNRLAPLRSRPRNGLSDHDVHVAHSGSEAFEAAKQLRPDICIFDIGMPDLNGYQLAERVRHEAWGKTMTLIALTGWGQESDRHRAMLAGFQVHISKPLEPQELIVTVASLAGRAVEARSAS